MKANFRMKSIHFLYEILFLYKIHHFLYKSIIYAINSVNTLKDVRTASKEEGNEWYTFSLVDFIMPARSQHRYQQSQSWHCILQRKMEK